VAISTDIARYLDFVLVMFLAFGIAFEVPVATVIVVLLGWVRTDQLREARPYVVVGAFVIAAIVTPPDVISQLLLAIPMCLLFELGLWVSARLEARDATKVGARP
jgi:sec-independent protein translocase protein TatC